MVLKPKEAKVKVLEGQGDAPMLVPRGHRYAVGQAGRSDLQGVVTPYVKRLGKAPVGAGSGFQGGL